MKYTKKCACGEREPAAFAPSQTWRCKKCMAAYARCDRDAAQAARVAAERAGIRRIPVLELLGAW